ALDHGAEGGDQLGMQPRMHAGKLGVALGRIDDRRQHRGPAGGAQPLRQIGGQHAGGAGEAAGIGRPALRAALRAGGDQQRGARRPVPVDRRLGDAGALRHGIHRQVAQSGLLQQLVGGGHHGLLRAADARVLALFLSLRAGAGFRSPRSPPPHQVVTPELRYDTVSYRYLHGWRVDDACGAASTEMTMTTGTILTALAFVTAAANLAAYHPKMTGNQATLRPRREQALMVLALALAGAGFLLGPGVVGYVIGGVAIVPAALFLLATATSGLPNQTLAVAVGDAAPDFSLVDAAGQPFRLSELAGSPVLLKFYRGYWCPYCVAELAQLDRYAEDFAALGVKLVAVGSDRVDELAPFRRKHGWAIRLLAGPRPLAPPLCNGPSPTVPPPARPCPA